VRWFDKPAPKVIQRHCWTATGGHNYENAFNIDPIQNSRMSLIVWGISALERGTSRANMIPLSLRNSEAISMSWLVAVVGSMLNAFLHLLFRLL
jgi:hypothetical protein